MASATVVVIPCTDNPADARPAKLYRVKRNIKELTALRIAKQHVTLPSATRAYMLHKLPLPPHPAQGRGARCARARSARLLAASAVERKRDPRASSSRQPSGSCFFPASSSPTLRRQSDPSPRASLRPSLRSSRPLPPKSAG